MMMMMQGLILGERHVANMMREIRLRLLEDDSPGAPSQDEETVVLLHAERFPQTTHWMTIKKARQLLYPGVKVRIQVVQEHEASGTASNLDAIGDSNHVVEPSQKLVVKNYAQNIQILSVHPSSPYLARVLLFSIEHLRQIFRDDTTHQAKFLASPSSPQSTSNAPPPALPYTMIAAFAPVGSARLHKAYTLAQDSKRVGQQVKLFKHIMMKTMSSEIATHLEAENDLIRAKPTHAHPPCVSKETYRALDRMEMQWSRGSPKDDVTSQARQWQTADSSAQRQQHPAHHALDPLHNLPDPRDERRRRYIDERKRPQIQCMLQFIQDLLPRGRDVCTTTHIVDVGGGRGYLGLAVAGTYGPHTHVTVLDNNPSSLAAGQERAQQAQLDNISFVLCDLNNDLSAVQAQLCSGLNQPSSKQPPRIDLVMGLHCCGGLAEAAVELAIQAGADFCVSTCCFRSNPELASLTQWTERQINDNEREQYCADVQKVATLAVTVGAKGQERAIRAYNNMRLWAAERRSNDKIDQGGNGDLSMNKRPKHEACEKDKPKMRRLETWQENFPLEYSVQNAVLVGRYFLDAKA